ncbi:flagellar hook protein FlgE [Methylibium rhizosphaerae]|jgi:flagellar hook protein FlgE|uniref:flagellar hook protein FlgE n=1 Tax=Methylibium rhizosphaerae TaxID=2570323 RepID=UPI00112AB0DD|nr:flagellar hook protein FlgE [Methylibium rhizosphaerae]
MGFQQGLSGLSASSRNLDVIGNNVANANTFGSKVARAEFADVYATSMTGAGTNSVGIGVQVAAVAQQFTQGNVTTTDNPMDIAINGAGFFQVSDGRNPTMYTRNGQFKIDREGYIVNNQRQRLLGYRADATGNIVPAQATPIQLPTVGIAPRATDQITMELNLDSRAAVTRPAGGGIDFNDPTTYNNATSVTAYDALGQDISLTYYFQKTGNGTWDVYVTANGSTVNGTAAAPLPVTSATFNAGGTTPTFVPDPPTINIPAGLTNSSGALIATPLAIPFDMDNATQYGASFGVTNLTQTGYAPGQLTSITIEGNGIIMARYSNGQSQPAGQIEIATFRNAQGLQPMGGNAWNATYASGDAVVGVPGDGNMGVLQAGALEESNVDLTAELVNMITAQRNYQANAQTIKTQDQVLQTLVNLR